MSEEQYLWDRIKHEENLFTSRANFFLVAEAMLFAGAASLLSEEGQFFVPTFSILAIVISILWILISCMQGYWTWSPLRRRMRELASDHRGEDRLACWYSQVSGRLRSATIIGVAVPLVCCVAWCAVFRVTK